MYTMSDVGSFTSDSLAQTNKSVTVKHLRTLAMGPKEAIKYSQKRSAHHLRRKKTNKRFCHFLLMRATVVHYNRKQARLWAWKAHGNNHLHCATFPRYGVVPGIMVGLSLTTMASVDGVNIWNAWIGSFLEITHYNWAQKASTNLPAFQGPDDPEN